MYNNGVKHLTEENAMKLIIVRHGDPDYSIDGLTEKGKKEFLRRENTDR